MDGGNPYGEYLPNSFNYGFLALLHPLSLPIAQRYHVAGSSHYYRSYRLAVGGHCKPLDAYSEYLDSGEFYLCCIPLMDSCHPWMLAYHPRRVGFSMDGRQPHVMRLSTWYMMRFVQN